jgi:hypothetical protein
MRKIIITAALALLAAALLAPVGTAADKGKHKGKRTYTTKLKGANEIPGPGDPDGKGHATIRLDSKRDRVCYTVETKRIARPTTLGHIHKGDSETAGPPVVDLFLTPSNQRVRHGCVATTQEIIDAIRTDPSGYYVNVHNGEFPTGAVRGQLHRSGH